jgi:hypothetical protein
MLLRSPTARLHSQLAHVLRRIAYLETKIVQASQKADCLEMLFGNLATKVAEYADGQIENGRKEAKPMWEKEVDGHWIGELRVGQRVLRKVRPIAKNIIEILDAFQDAEWAPSIKGPLPGNDQQQRHEAIRSLNTRLKGIRFCGDGKNERIRWEWD